MKRTISFLIALVLSMTLTVPAFAAEFVPSITDKEAPEIVPVKDEDGKDAIGVLLDQDGNIVGYLYEDCLLVTPVSQARTSEKIPDDAEELLLSVYQQLSNGTMSLPYEKHNANLDPATMVIKDLFDVSWLCGPENPDVTDPDHPDHPAEVAKPEITVRLVFDLNVASNAKVFCMSYKNNAWNPVISCVNNGDGTVTADFHDFCPVAFSVGDTFVNDQAPTGDESKIDIWLIVLAVSVVALGAVLVFFRPKKAC